MVFEICGNVLLLSTLWIVYGNQVLVIIAQLEIGLIEKLIFFDVAEHFQCAAAFVEIIIIGKQVAEILFQFFPCLVGKVEYIQIIGVKSAAI